MEEIGERKLRHIYYHPDRNVSHVLWRFTWDEISEDVSLRAGGLSDEMVHSDAFFHRSDRDEGRILINMTINSLMWYV